MSSVPTLDEALTAWADNDHSAKYQMRHGSDEQAAIYSSLAASAATVAQILAQREQAPQ